MGVPVEIRQVARPRNTVVVDTGSNGPNRYAVRERGKSICKPHKNPAPRNGHGRLSTEAVEDLRRGCR